MTYDEMKALIEDSTKGYWLHDDGMRVFTFKQDLNIRIQEVSDQSGERFEEEWATKHSDPSARRYYYDLYYGASFVERFYFVSVDGGRATIPLPQSATELVINRWQYTIAQVIDTTNTLDSYLGRCGISVSDESDN